MVATNGVVTTGSYSDPSWITSLSSSKISTPSSLSITSTGSSTSRTLATRFADIVNVKDYGAVGNGVTNDRNAIQAALDAVVSSGQTGLVYFPPGIYKINSGITVNSSFVSIEGYCEINASAITSGTAITITASISSSEMGVGFTRDSHIFGNIRITGPGYTSTNSVGIKFESASPVAYARALIENLSVVSFGTGILHGSYAWGMTLSHCTILDCGNNVSFPSSSVDSGERIVYYGCLIAGGFISNINAGSAAELFFTNCSIDYPGQAYGTGSISGTTLTITSIPEPRLRRAFAVGDYLSMFDGLGTQLASGTRITAFGTGTGGVGTYTITPSQTRSSTAIYGSAGRHIIVNGGRVECSGCHIEAEKSNDAFFEIGPSNGTTLRIFGGDIGLRSGYAQVSSIFKISNSAGQRVNLLIDGVHFGWSTNLTNPYLVDTTGVSETRNVVIKFKDTTTYEIYTLPILSSSLNNKLMDPSMDAATLSDCFVWEDTAAITNRLTGTNITLARSNVTSRSGSNSLRATKVGANSNASGFAIVGQLSNPGGSICGTRFWWKNQNNLSGNIDVLLGFANVSQSTVAGVPITNNLLLSGVTTVSVTGVGTSNFVEFTAGGFVSPEWATHCFIIIKLNNFNTSGTNGSLFFDDFEMTEI